MLRKPAVKPAIEQTIATTSNSAEYCQVTCPTQIRTEIAKKPRMLFMNTPP